MEINFMMILYNIYTIPYNGVNPHSVVVLDNCAIHQVTSTLNGIGVLILFLPPYSPDFNPIEEECRQT